MSQTIYTTINPATTSGTQLAALLVDFKNAVVSGFNGTSRPTNLQGGGYWIDTTNEASGTGYWIFKLFTGSVDIEIFRVNLATAKASIASADTTFEVARISADAVGPILNLTKRRIANGGQDLTGDVIGEVRFNGRASDSSNPIVARMRVIATNDMTSSASGSYIVFEQTAAGSNTATEAMRLVDSKLGVGQTLPTALIHAKGATGIKSERASDDALGAIFTLFKQRLTGSVAAINDVLGTQFFSTATATAVETQVAAIEVSASQAHTLSSAMGTLMKFKAILTGTNALITQFSIGDIIESIATHRLNALELVSQSIATAATFAQMNADKCVNILTGSTATLIYGLNSTGKSKVIVIHNASSAVITVVHESASATNAVDRFSLPAAGDIDVNPGSSIELFYSTADSRWKVKSGSGSGGGSYKVTSVQTVASGGAVVTTTQDLRQLRHVQGTAAQTAISVTAPFGSSGGWKDGTELLLVGNSDANSLVLTNSDTTKGIVGNFDTIEIGLYGVVKLVWSSSLDRWILQNK